MKSVDNIAAICNVGGCPDIFFWRMSKMFVGEKKTGS